MLWVGGVLAMYIYKRRWNWAMMKSQLTSTRTPSLRLYLSFSPFLSSFLSLFPPFSLPSVSFAQCTNTSNVPGMYVRKVSQVDTYLKVLINVSSCPAKHLAPRHASARSTLQRLPYLICKF